MNDELVPWSEDWIRIKEAELEPICSDCGGPGPFWVDNSGYPSVCKKCVEKKHKGIIRMLSLINALFLVQ